MSIYQKVEAGALHCSQIIAWNTFPRAQCRGVWGWLLRKSELCACTVHETTWLLLSLGQHSFPPSPIHWASPGPAGTLISSHSDWGDCWTRGLVLAEEKLTVNWNITKLYYSLKNEQTLLTLPKQNFKMVELSSSKATTTLLERYL